MVQGKGKGRGRDAQGLGGVGGGQLSRACRAGTVRVTLVRRSPASLGLGRTGGRPPLHIYMSY